MRNEIANFKNCKSIAIMGGTFDPIHYGDFVTAEAVRHRFQVDKVVFIPTGKPAHKTDKAVTHNEHRYLMAVLATMRNENFEVSRIEIDRPGVTYTIDTIEQLKKLCRPDVRLYFITGADAIHQIMSWKESERLLSLCDFVAVTRPGYQKTRCLRRLERYRINMPAEYTTWKCRHWQSLLRISAAARSEACRFNICCHRKWWTIFINLGYTKMREKKR